MQRVVPAPDNLSNPVIGVPAGSDIELDLRLEAVMEGVLVSGTAAVALSGECGRCLDALQAGLDVDLQELYVYPGNSEPDDELPEIVEEMLDLEPALRDAAVLA
ncbi:MAG: YceD family protein, partial [Blastococcus sp.]